MTVTGSIGSITAKFDLSEMYDKLGIGFSHVTKGPNARFFGSDRGFTDEEFKRFEERHQASFHVWVEGIAEHRNLTIEEVESLGQGRVWTGRQALGRGLVDAEGGLRRALDSAKWTLGLDRDDRIAVVSYGKELTFFERLVLQSLRRNVQLRGAVGDLAAGAGWAGESPLAGLPLPTLLETLRDNGTLARVALMDGRPVAMAPFWLAVE